MWAWLPYNLREPATVEAIGRRIKETVARDVSPVIKVSIGAGPNKLPGEDGQQDAQARRAVRHRTPPTCRRSCTRSKLRDCTGIGPQHGSTPARRGHPHRGEPVRGPKPALRGVWGGVIGDRLWHLLRGDEIPDLVSGRKSIGHSHVLPPDSRPPGQAWPVLCKLLHKACERLRSHALLTGSLTVRLDFPGGPPWSADAHTVETDSTIALMHLMERLWQDRPEPARQILKVGVVLTRLCAQDNHTPRCSGPASGHRGGRHVRRRQTPAAGCRRRQAARALRPRGGLLRQRAGEPRRRTHAHQLHPHPRSGAGAGLMAVGQFCDHYHRERNHQGLENRIIEPEFGSAEEGEVNCRERLGGLLRYYYRDAA